MEANVAQNEKILNRIGMRKVVLYVLLTFPFFQIDSIVTLVGPAGRVYA